MSIEANKSIVRRVIDEIFLEGKETAVDELLSEDFVGHSGPSSGDGRKDMKATIRRVAGGLSDATMKIHDVIAEDDRVAVRLTSHAVQVGQFMGLKPSGRAYTIDEIHIFRLRDGRVCEHWHQGDFLGMMRQLGALPGPG